MHSVWTENDQDFGTSGKLARGCYIVEDEDVAQLLLMAGGGELQLQHFDTSNTLRGRDSYDGAQILIVRPGRFGDLVLLSPVLREIKRRWPTCTLSVATMPNYRQAIIGLPYIDGFVDYPVSIEHADNVILLDLENLKALEPAAKEHHITDLFATRLGLDPATIENKAPDLFLSEEERTWAAEKYPRIASVKRIGLQLCASDKVRTYPEKQMMQTLQFLHKAGYDLQVMGLPHEVKGPSFARARNVAADRLTFRQSCAVLGTCDLFIGPDSSLLHVAAGLRMPALALYGPFPADLRTRYHPNTFVIESTRGCEWAPCFHSQLRSGTWPENGPCRKTGRCEALNSINPAEILHRVQKIIGGAKAG